MINLYVIYYHMESDKDLIEKLMVERKKIDDQITQIVSKSYSKYGMSDVVKDDNPYSRLMALKKMGIVENYGVRFYLRRISRIRVCLLWE